MSPIPSPMQTNPPGLLCTHKHAQGDLGGTLWLSSRKQPPQLHCDLSPVPVPRSGCHTGSSPAHATWHPGPCAASDSGSLGSTAQFAGKGWAPRPHSHRRGLVGEAPGAVFHPSREPGWSRAPVGICSLPRFPEQVFPSELASNPSLVLPDLPWSCRHHNS